MTDFCQTFFYAASVHCISFQVLPSKVSVLRADEPALVSSQGLEPFHTGIISLCVYFVSSLPKYLK